MSDQQKMWTAVQRVVTETLVEQVVEGDCGLPTRRDADMVAAHIADEISSRFSLEWRKDCQ